MGLNQYCYFRTSLDSAAGLLAPLQDLADKLGHQSNSTAQVFRRVDKAKPYATWMFVFAGVSATQAAYTRQRIESALAQAELGDLLTSPVQVETFEAVATGDPK